MKKILPLLMTLSISTLLQSGQFSQAADNQTDNIRRTEYPIQIAELIANPLPAGLSSVPPIAAPTVTRAAAPDQTLFLRRRIIKVVSSPAKTASKKVAVAEKSAVASTHTASAAMADAGVTKSTKTRTKTSRRSKRTKKRNRATASFCNKKRAEEDLVKSVSLTFDDGPSPVYTAKVLTILKREHVHATFCLIGRQVKKYPQLVQQIVAEGHQVADHSMNHDEHLDRKSDAKIKQEILGTKELIESVVPGTTVEFYRAPAGNINQHQKELLAEWGMKPLGWSVDTKDWQRPGVDEIMSHVKAQLHSGGVILMHDAGGDRSESVEALEKIIAQLKNDGYQFVFPGEKPAQQVASR